MAVAAEQKTTEPSMEEILASIRRIISDDQQPAQPVSNPSHTVEAFKPSNTVPQADKVAFVTPPSPALSHQSSTAPVSQTIDQVNTGIEDDVFELTMPAVQPAFEEQSKVSVDEKPIFTSGPEHHYTPVQPSTFESFIPNEPLIGSKTDKLVSNSFDSLAHTVLSQNARTIDDVVKDILRPMLKSWLDNNLPTIVERLVRSEIERVSRGGR